MSTQKLHLNCIGSSVTTIDEQCKCTYHHIRAFQEFEDSEEYGVAVLTGRGGNFCAGYDLKELAGMESARTVVGEYGVGPAPMVNINFNGSFVHVYCLNYRVLPTCN